MKALFSRRNHYDGTTPSTSSTSTSTQETVSRRSRTISTKSIFDRQKRSQAYPSSYAEPQDLLYPTDGTYGKSAGNHLNAKPTSSPFNGRHLLAEKAAGSTRGGPALSPREQVGDAPASINPAAGNYARRRNKGLFNSWKSSHAIQLSGKGTEDSNQKSNERECVVLGCASSRKSMGF